jgi:ATP-dependent RNA helicase SUPV3L1/SUV3
VHLDRRIERVSEAGRDAVVERLKNWVRAQVERSLGQLRSAGLAAQDPASPAGVRSILAMLVDEGGIIAREAIATPLATLDREQRRAISRLKVKIGALDLFMPDILKPEARRWRTALRTAAAGEVMPILPPHSAVVLPCSADDPERALLRRLGFRPLGRQMVRVDLVERLARHAHEARTGKQASVVDEPLATSLGLAPQTVAKLMRDIGFRPASSAAGWIWKGRSRPRPGPAREPSGAFAALAGLRRG